MPQFCEQEVHRQIYRGVRPVSLIELQKQIKLVNTKILFSLLSIEGQSIVLSCGHVRHSKTVQLSKGKTYRCGTLLESKID